MPRPQFTLRALLVLMFGAACFFGGIHFERERRRRADMAGAFTDPKKTGVMLQVQGGRGL